MKRTKEIDRIVVSAGDADFRPYDRYGKVIDGMSWKPVRYDPKTGTGSFVLRFEPGARSQPHEHGGVEEFLILSGTLIDADGRRFVSGDLVSFGPGSRHWSHTPEGCTIAVFLRGRNRLLDADEA